MTDKELMQQALEALEEIADEVFSAYDNKLGEVILALRERLAQPEQEPVAHSIVAGALFDFMGWLTSRKERLVLSSSAEASPAVEAIQEFAKMRGLSLADADVQNWQQALASQQPREWVGLTEEEVDECYYWKGRQWTTDELVRHVEAKLKEKNA